MEDEVVTLLRRVMAMDINSQVTSADKGEERKRLEEKYGKVWDTQELQNDFIVHGFAAPFCMATRKADQKDGVLIFQHMPRLYFDFMEK